MVHTYQNFLKVQEPSIRHVKKSMIRSLYIWLGKVNQTFRTLKGWFGPNVLII